MNNKVTRFLCFFRRGAVWVFVFIIVQFMSYDLSGQDGIDYPFYRVLSTKQFNKEQFKLNQEYESAWRAYETKHLEQRDNHKIKSEGFTLSIVFHAMYTDDIERVKSDVDIQLAALNRDFGSPQALDYKSGDPGATFSSLAENPNIMFKLYEEETHGLVSKGISTVEKRERRWQHFGEIREVLTADIKSLNSNKVINVWVVKLDDKLGSFAQIPGGSRDTDGIVIDYRTFGGGIAPYNQGKTLTHLMGNYLGLMDLWGVYPCQDDGVVDTPVHNGPNYHYPNHRHISTCPGAQVEMTMNFMDNMVDEHVWMFTKGQVKRLHFMLSSGGPRNHLIN